MIHAELYSNSFLFFFFSCLPEWGGILLFSCFGFVSLLFDFEEHVLPNLIAREY